MGPNLENYPKSVKGLGFRVLGDKTEAKGPPPPYQKAHRTGVTERKRVTGEVLKYQSIITAPPPPNTSTCCIWGPVSGICSAMTRMTNFLN